MPSAFDGFCSSNDGCGMQVWFNVSGRAETDQRIIYFYPIEELITLFYNGASDPYLHFALYTGSEYCVNDVGATVITNNTWHQVFMNLNKTKGSFEIWLDGQIEYNKSSGCTTYGSDADRSSAIGGYPWVEGGQFYGWFDEVKFWKGGLNDRKQITNLFNYGTLDSPTPISTFGLNITYPLEGSTINDSFYINVTANTSTVCGINNTGWSLDWNNSANYSFKNVTTPSDGFYSIKINCSKSGVFENITRNFWIDKAFPSITPFSSFGTNTTKVINGTLNTYFNFSDNVQIFSYNITLSNGTVFNLNNIGIKNYTYNLSINLSQLGWWNLTLIVCDGSLVNFNCLKKVYKFEVMGSLNVTTNNTYDGTRFEGFSVLINNTIYAFSGDSGLITNLSIGNYSIFYNKTGYLNTTFNVSINSLLQYSNFNTSQSLVQFIILNKFLQTNLTNVNITITNNVSNYVTSVFSLQNLTSLRINATGYNITVISDYFQPYHGSFFILPNEIKLIYLNLTNLANLTLFDEVTELPFNMSSADSVKVLVFCPDSTYQTYLNSTNTILSIDCDYNKLKFILTYGTTSYYRTVMIPKSEIYDTNIYLINLHTTTSIYNSFIVDDLMDDYDDTKIYIKKKIGNATYQITADNTDIEDKISAYLVENNEYEIELTSSNQPTRVFGAYSASVAGNKVLRLYDINSLDQDLSFYNTVGWAMRWENLTDGNYVIAKYTDSANQTNSLSFYLWRDSYNGTLIYNNTRTKAQGTTDVEYTINVSAYDDYTIVGGFSFDNTQLSFHDVAKTLHAVNTIIMEMFDYISPGAIQWFFVLLLGAIALMATIESANPVSLVIVALAALFKIFGWFAPTNNWLYGILALGGLFSLISIIKKGDKSESSV